MMRMLDLFCGLGGASEAMYNHPDWQVIRIDNNPDLLQHLSFVCKDVKTVLEEIKTMNLRPSLLNIDLVWASPPCTEFSEGYNSPKCKHRRADSEEEYQPDMSLLEITLKIIEALKPRYWIIENVKGAVEFFEPLLGPPKVIIGPYYLWGNFPLFDAKLKPGYSKQNDEDRLGRKFRPNVRALVPFEISEACRQSIQYQKRLDDYSVKVQSKRSPK